MLRRQMNVFDLAAVLLLVVFLLALTVPVNVASARSSRRSMHSTQMRGMHQGLITFANSNRNYFPGLDRTGDPAGLNVENRYQLLLDGNYFTPEYAISPMESDPSITEYAYTGAVTANNYSFAMLQVPHAGGRYTEWSATLNSQAVVMSDRNTGTEIDTYGIHNDRWESSSLMGCSYNHRQPYVDAGHWIGSVLYNDNHVTFIETDTLEDSKYGDVSVTADKLFSSPGENDALLVHTGN